MHIVQQLKYKTQVFFFTLQDKGKGYATRLKTNNQAHSEEQQKIQRAVQRACARCRAAGRIKEAIGHKGSNCPYSSSIDPIVITDSEGDNDESSDEDE
jgi:hypothetical protein